MKKRTIEELFDGLDIDHDGPIADREVLVDKFGLDDACATHSQRFLFWSKKYSDAFWLHDRVEDKYERVCAQVELNVRGDPEKYGVTPDKQGAVKEGAVKATVKLDEEVMEWKKKLLTASYLKRRYKRIKEGFVERGWMIKEEGALWRDEYYSEVEIKKATETKRRSTRIRGERLGKK